MSADFATEFARKQKNGDWDIRFADGSRMVLSGSVVKDRIISREKWTEEPLPEWIIEAKVISLAKRISAD